MRVLGMISGTSHDGIDVAVVDFAMDGGTLACRIEHSDSVPYDPQLRSRIIAALPPARPGFEAACELDTSIGQAFAAVAADVLAALGPDRPDLICSHGQTVFHWVVDGHARGTLQLGQPAWIAEATGVPVLSDVRAADVAAGGEGAPLVSVLDRMLLEPYRAAGVRAGALNLGGISNITVCAPDAEPTAWDIGTANALIDAVVTAEPATPDTFDRDGALAASGTVIPALLTELLAEPYYRLPPPKSSGKELFHLGYVHQAIGRAGVRPGLADLVATLAELAAVTVAGAVSEAKVEVLVAAGGGVRNPVLMGRITAAAARRRRAHHRPARRARRRQGGLRLRPHRLGDRARPAGQRAQLHRRGRAAGARPHHPRPRRPPAAGQPPGRLADRAEHHRAGRTGCPGDTR